MPFVNSRPTQMHVWDASYKYLHLATSPQNCLSEYVTVMHVCISRSRQIQLLLLIYKEQ